MNCPCCNYPECGHNHDQSFITAKQARESYHSQPDFQVYLKRIEQAIQSSIDHFERSVNVELGTSQHLYDFLSDFLVKKGYSVSWNRACLWMEISW